MIGLPLCGCGCGEPTQRKYGGSGNRDGEFSRFLRGHSTRLRPKKNPELGPMRWLTKTGYVALTLPGGGWRREHIVIAERALGRPMPVGAVVHHVNHDSTDNRRENLVICQDHAYHMLLHRRERARDACGDPNALRCHICSGYDRQEDMRVRARAGNRESSTHRSCAAAVNRKRRAAATLKRGLR